VVGGHDDADYQGKNGVAPDLLIASDTVVALDREILEKPKDKSHAIEMLSKLSNREHTVYTGVVLILKKRNGGLEDSLHCVTPAHLPESPLHCVLNP